MTIAILSVALVALCVPLVMLWSRTRVYQDAATGLADELEVLRARIEEVPDAPMTELPPDNILQRVLFLEDRMEDLTLAVAEGIKHVERAENRIRATVSRARKELEEHGVQSPGLDAEYRELSVIDGGGGPEGGMPEVHQSMVPAQSSVPGVSPDQLRRVRGF